MSRNKHPEETVQKILDASTRLFMERGYENTSIQDIINELKGLSKGAIYHHFASKEDILVAVIDRLTCDSNKMRDEIRDRTDLSGKDKLKTIFKSSICRPVQNDIFRIAPDFKKNHKLLFLLIDDTINTVAPDYILPIIQQGISDGTIKTSYPAQLAELIILAANVWTNPMIFNNTPEETCNKFMILNQMLQGFGLDILDDDMLQRLHELATIYSDSKKG